jgi:hypothetical protein
VVTSKTIHIGQITIIEATIIPKGFMINDLKILPENIAKTALVVPHEGHGKVVIDLIIHVVKPTFELLLFTKNNHP